MSVSENNNRYQKGLAILEERFGEARTEDMIQSLAQAYDFFAQVNVEFPFGDLHSRENILSSKTREIATIAALTVQGFSLPQLRLHMIAALRVGVTREEILETITLMIAYAGFPAATNALLTAKTLFQDLDTGKEIL